MTTDCLTIECGDRSLQLDRPGIMGILNVTPDSFSDGGRYAALDTALEHARSMVKAGAQIIDIGGESTRPGAEAVDAQQEIDRVLPVLEAIKSRFDTIVSVDTSKAGVMRAAASAGAGMLNDVRAFSDPGALQAAADSKLPICIMHMQGQPRTMQASPHYSDVVSEVTEFLIKRRLECAAAGVAAKQILIDPGFGFGKNLDHNLELLRNLDKLADIAPVVAGLSRKSMLGSMLGDPHEDRTVASVVAAMECVIRGAALVRVHDVPQTAQALKVIHAIYQDQDDTG